MIAARPSRVGSMSMNQAGSASCENLDVFALRRPEPMQHDPEGTMALVLLDIEKRAGIARPDDVAGRIVDAVGKVLAALDVANRDGENLRAEIVGAPGEFASGRANGARCAK